MAQKGKYLAAVSAAFLFISPMNAQDTRSNLHINSGLSYMLTENIDSGFKTGFGFSFPLLKKTSVTFDFGYWKSSVHKEPKGLFNGTLSMAPFHVSLYYTLFENKNFMPYVFGGTGFIFTHFEIKDLITIPEVSIDQEVSNGISFHAGAGSLLKINQRLALYGEACFLLIKGDGITTFTDMNRGVSTENFSLNLDSFVFCLGIKYYL